MKSPVPYEIGMLLLYRGAPGLIFKLERDQKMIKIFWLDMQYSPSWVSFKWADVYCKIL